MGRAHLGNLVGAVPASRTRAVPTVQRVRPGLHQFLDALDAQPALVLGRRTDVLASNRMARVLLTDFDRMRPRERNYARWIMLSDEARQLFVDWHEQARSAVENLRFDAGNHPDDRSTRELVAELSDGSPEFRQWWSEHHVHQRTFGSKRLRHPIVGDLTVDYETFLMPADPDQTLFIYTTEAGTASRQAMDLLASWAQPSRSPRAT